MRALLCHCRNFRSDITGLSTAPIGIEPEPVTSEHYESSDAILALITVEDTDTIQDFAGKISNEIRKFAEQVGHTTIVLFPFGHLSNKLADSNITKEFFSILEKELSDLKPLRIHFGSDKSLFLDSFGHKGNFRYREFNA